MNMSIWSKKNNTYKSPQKLEKKQFDKNMKKCAINKITGMTMCHR